MTGGQPEDRSRLALTGQILALGAVYVLPAGLLVRSRHWSSLAGRLVATVGGLLFVAVVTLPMRDEIPVVTAVDALSTGRLLPVAIAIFSVLLLGLLGFFAWLPARMSAGAGWLAWIVLVAPPLAVIGLVAKETEELAVIARNPAATVFPALWLLAAAALGAYGLAQLIGRFDAWRA